jgi:hypothetical protein
MDIDGTVARCATTITRFWNAECQSGLRDGLAPEHHTTHLSCFPAELRPGEILRALPPGTYILLNSNICSMVEAHRFGQFCLRDALSNSSSCRLYQRHGGGVVG